MWGVTVMPSQRSCTRATTRQGCIFVMTVRAAWVDTRHGTHTHTHDWPPSMEEYCTACAQGDVAAIAAHLNAHLKAAHSVRGFMLAVAGGHGDAVRTILSKPHSNLLREPLAESESSEVGGEEPAGICALQTALQVAVACGHRGVVRAILEVTPAYPFIHQLHAFMVACENKWGDMVEVLLPAVVDKTDVWAGDLIRAALCGGYGDAASALLSHVVTKVHSTRRRPRPVYSAIWWLLFPPNGEVWSHDMYATVLRCVGHACESEAADVAAKWRSTCKTDEERAVVTRTIDETCPNPGRVHGGEACLYCGP